MEYLKLTLVGDVPSLKNDRIFRQIGGVKVAARMISIPTAAYHKWFVNSFNQICNQCPVDYLFRHVTIKYTIFMGTHRKIDLSNCIQSIEDLMRDAYVIQDDNYSVISRYSAKAVYRKNFGGAEILIHNLDFAR